MPRATQLGVDILSPDPVAYPTNECMKGNMCGEGLLTLCLCRDDVLLLVFVETRNALYGHVVGLGRTRGEDNLLWVSAD